MLSRQNMPQSRNPSGFFWPHAAQICTPLRYRAGSGSIDSALIEQRRPPIRRREVIGQAFIGPGRVRAVAVR